MMRIDGRIVWTVVALVLFTGMVAVEWARSDRTVSVDEHAIRVVSTGQRDGPTPQGGAYGTSMASVPSPVPSFDAMTVVERNIAIHARPRDGDWAPAMEARLTAAVNAMTGIRVDRVFCASGACELIAIREPVVGDDQGTVFASLQDGPLQRAYAAAGLVPNGGVTINVDDRGALHLTQYLGVVQ